MVEKSTVLGSNLRNRDFDGFMCFEVPKIALLAFGLCVCVNQGRTVLVNLGYHSNTSFLQK